MRCCLRVSSVKHQEGREWSEQETRARRYIDHSDHRRRAPHSGSVGGAVPPPMQLPPAAVAAAGAAVVDRRSSSKQPFLPADADQAQLDHPRNDNHHHMSPESGVGDTSSQPPVGKHVADHPITPKINSCKCIAEQTTPKLGFYNTGTFAERHESQLHPHEGDNRHGGKKVGGASGGGSGGGGDSLLGSSSQSAGGTSTDFSSQEPSILVRRNDSILKILLTGSGVDSEVGVSKELYIPRECYEFELWKQKKAKSTALSSKTFHMPAAEAITTTSVRTDDTTELPPPPLKGMGPNTMGVVASFSQAAEDAIGAAGDRARELSARKPLEVMTTTAPRYGQQSIGVGGVGGGGGGIRGGGRRPSLSPSSHIIAAPTLPGFPKIPGRRPLGAVETGSADACGGEKEEPGSTSHHRCSAQDAPQQACVPPSLVEHRQGNTSSASSTDGRTGNLRPCVRESPPCHGIVGFSPSPAPFPSPRQSPRRSPRAELAGTRLCAEAAALSADRNGGGIVKGDHGGGLRRLKASPPLVASRFPLDGCGGDVRRFESGEREEGQRKDARGSSSGSGNSGSGGGGGGGVTRNGAHDTFCGEGNDGDAGSYVNHKKTTATATVMPDKFPPSLVLGYSSVHSASRYLLVGAWSVSGASTVH